MEKHAQYSTDYRAELNVGTYIGVDAAIGGTGIVVIRVQPPNYHVVHRTTVKFSVADAEGVAFGRVPLVKNSLAHLIREHNPVLVAQEDYIRNIGMRNMNYPFQIAELGGALKCVYHERRQPYILVNNARLRSMADIEKGENTKDGVLRFVQTRYGVANIGPKEHDQADAFVLALCAFIAHRLLVDDWMPVLNWFSERKVKLFASKRKHKGKLTGILQNADTYVGFDSLPDFDVTKLERLVRVMYPGAKNVKGREEKAAE